MNIQEITSRIDHTLLNVDCTWEQIRQLCDEAIEYETASVCIPPSFVKKAKDYVQSRMRLCTVVGFPNGYCTTSVKVFETQNAIENGADELDMVINIGALRSGNLAFVEKEIKVIKAVCGDRILKVIIEACLLSEDEKLAMCRIITATGADFIKTSTGFSRGGATFDDVKLISENIGPEVKIKAAGGISSIGDAKTLINLGCARLGTSRIIKILKERG